MGRPKLAATIAKEETKVEKLERELAEMREMMTQLMSANTNVAKQETPKISYHIEDNDEDDIQISTDKYIKVISLTPNSLTLTTQVYGRGKPFNFEKFGEVKRIKFGDLNDICEAHRNLVEQGCFYILDRQAIKKLGLDDIYKNILTKEIIDKIMFGDNQSDAANLFKSANDTQREYISRMMVERLLAGENIDLNLLDRLDRIACYNEKGERVKLGIHERYEEMKALKPKN